MVIFNCVVNNKIESILCTDIDKKYINVFI